MAATICQIRWRKLSWIVIATHSQNAKISETDSIGDISYSYIIKLVQSGSVRKKIAEVHKKQTVICHILAIAAAFIDNTSAPENGAFQWRPGWFSRNTNL